MNFLERRNHSDAGRYDGCCISQIWNYLSLTCQPSVAALMFSGRLEVSEVWSSESKKMNLIFLETFVLGIEELQLLVSSPSLSSSLPLFLDLSFFVISLFWFRLLHKANLRLFLFGLHRNHFFTNNFEVSALFLIQKLWMAQQYIMHFVCYRVISRTATSHCKCELNVKPSGIWTHNNAMLYFFLFILEMMCIV